MVVPVLTTDDSQDLYACTLLSISLVDLSNPQVGVSSCVFLLS